MTRPMSGTIPLSLLLVALGVWTGCNPENPPSDGGTSTPQDAGAADASTMDAGGPLDAGSEPRVRTGFITLRSNPEPTQTRVSATFLAGGPAFVCDEQVVGPCVFVACTPRTPDPVPPLHSGTISVAGGRFNVTLEPAADQFYDVDVTAQQLWLGGEQLLVSSTGGGVAAFSGVVTGPAQMTLVQPVLPSSAVWAVPRDQDLTLEWTGLGAEDVVLIVGTTATQDPTEVECHFPGAVGMGTVPAAALQLLPAGQGYFSLANQFRTRVAAGEWSVALRAESDALLSNGTWGFGELRLE